VAHSSQQADATVQWKMLYLRCDWQLRQTNTHTPPFFSPVHWASLATKKSLRSSRGLGLASPLSLLSFRFKLYFLQSAQIPPPKFFFRVYSCLYFHIHWQREIAKSYCSSPPRASSASVEAKEVKEGAALRLGLVFWFCVDPNTVEARLNTASPSVCLRSKTDVFVVRAV